MTTPLDIPISDIPIACELTGEEMATRRQDGLGNLWSKIKEKQKLADGYAFRFPNTDSVAHELLAFTLVERQCCSFFQIELVFMPRRGSVWLRPRGGDGVKQFIEAELVDL